MGGAGLLEALVEDDGVVIDAAVLAETDVADTAAVGTGIVATDPVVVNAVAVGTGADRHAATRAAVAGGSFHGAVLGDGVVVDLHVVVVVEACYAATDQRRRAGDATVRIFNLAGEGRGLEVGHADADTAVECAGVAVDAVVGDLQAMRPAVHVDAAARVAAGDADGVDTRRSAGEVAFTQLMERDATVRRVIADRGVRATYRSGILRQHGNAGTLFGTQHRRFEQHRPTRNNLGRQRIDLRYACGDAGGAVDREQVVDGGPPSLEFAGWILGRVDDDRGRTDALQTDRLPHDDQFVVRARVDQDEISRRGGVDSRLYGLTRASLHALRCRSAQGDRDGVNCRFAVGGRYHQFTGRRVIGHVDRNGSIAPGHVRSRDRNATDRHRSLGGAKAVVPLNGPLAGWTGQGEGACVSRIRHVM